MQNDRHQARADVQPAERFEYMSSMLKDLEVLAASEGHETLANLLRRAEAEVRSPATKADLVVQMADMIAELKSLAATSGSSALAHHLGYALDEARRVIARR